jgi:hypothetical protein
MYKQDPFLYSFTLCLNTDFHKIASRLCTISLFRVVEEYKYWTVTVKGESADENVITKFHSL